MSLLFTLPQPATVTVAAVDPRDLGGEDIVMPLIVTPAGDWATVKNVDAARQSILREIPASPGVFVRRPTWGGGLSGQLFKGATSAVRDQSISAVKARLAANPRVARVREVSGSLPETGLKLTIRVDALGGPLDITVNK